MQCQVGQRRTIVARLLAHAYRATDAVADKFGFYDLSARIIGLLHEVAKESCDESVIATAAYVRGEVFFVNGQLETGRRMLERAAERLLPDCDTGTAAAYGSLHMRAAVFAARDGRRRVACDHLAEARSYACSVPEGAYHGTVFGPASVRIHEIALAVDSDDPDTALRVAAGWLPPVDLPAERRSHFYIELARANAQRNAPQQALVALLNARTIAPQHVRDHPHVGQVLATLNQTRIGRDDRVVDYLRWNGQPVKQRSGVPGQAARPGS